jgi:hypothetical protein
LRESLQLLLKALDCFCVHGQLLSG